MSATSNTLSPTPSRTDLLALGFGITVAQWGCGFLGRLQPDLVPSAALLAAFLVCWAVGGWLTGRFSQGGAFRGIQVGVLSATLNMLILGSLLGGEHPNSIVPSALLWIPGSYLIAVAVCGVTAWLGAMHRPDREPPAWSFWFACVAAAGTLLLISVGGLVTSKEAGLAVVDWPNSFGYNMFLYPLGRMTGGIYYEHAHRLLGSLVGLTTLVLALYLQFSQSGSKFLRGLGWMALLAVMVQGLLGGLRVTGHLTLSTDPSETAPNLVLAAVHGVFGQVIFGLLVVIAVLLSRSRGRDHETAARATNGDRLLAAATLLLLIAQVGVGAVQRHFSAGLLLHISLAGLVTVAAALTGVRAWGIYGHRPHLNRLGLALTVVMGVQLVLGLLALYAVTGFEGDQATTPLPVSLATAHQAMGAVLIGLTAAICTYFQLGSERQDHVV